MINSKMINARTLDDLNAKLKIRYPYREQNVILNDFGFRDTELSLDVDVCYYGCSITYGTGVSDSQRWTNKIDQHLKLKSNNFGVSGVGIKEIEKLFLATSAFVKMKKAVFLLPEICRLTMPIIVNEQNVCYTNIFPLHFSAKIDPADITAKSKKEISQIYFQMPESYFVDEFKNSLDTIIYVANLRNIDLIISSWSDNVINILSQDVNNLDKYVLNINQEQICDNKALDNNHPSPRAHTIIANKFLQRF